jgi:hypothetical protein
MLRNQPWLLIVSLGLFALIRPLFSILGAYDSGLVAKPFGPIVLTIAIALVWIGAAVIYRVKKPVETLALAGVAYGVFATVLNSTLVAMGYGDAHLIPVPGVIATIVMEAIFGAVCGLIAASILRLRSR